MKLYVRRFNFHPFGQRTKVFIPKKGFFFRNQSIPVLVCLEWNNSGGIIEPLQSSWSISNASERSFVLPGKW